MGATPRLAWTTSSLLLLPLATGCWPGVPIAAAITKNASNRHSHEVTATVLLSGTIVTDPTVFGPEPPGGDAALVPAGPVLDLSAAEVDFGATGANLVVQALNAGEGTLTVDALSATPIVGTDTAWLDFNLLADGRTIALAADRTGYADGAYQARVDVASSGGAGSFLVDLTVGATTPTPIGPVIVELLAADGVTVVATVTTTAAEGYAWTLPSVPQGSYFLIAGVDLDSDGVIGEAGEPFGAYPTAAGKQILEVDALSDLSVDLLVQ